MNIEEYRAMKAQMEEEAQKEKETPTTVEDDTPEPTPTDSFEQPESASQPTEEHPSETPTEPTPPQTIEIEGIGEIPIEELAKGYLRQADYTRKTQELAYNRKRIEQAQRVYESIIQNPEVAQMLIDDHGLEIQDPRELETEELRDRYHDLLLEREISDLQSRYADFDPMEVLPYAFENKLENLEQAYLLVNQMKVASVQPDPVDIEALTEQIRLQVLADLQSKVDTSSVIQTGGDSAPVRDNTPTLTQAELKVAKNLRLSPEEYAQWRDKR